MTLRWTRIIVLTHRIAWKVSVIFILVSAVPSIFQPIYRFLICTFPLFFLLMLILTFLFGFLLMTWAAWTGTIAPISFLLVLVMPKLTCLIQFIIFWTQYMPKVMPLYLFAFALLSLLFIVIINLIFLMMLVILGLAFRICRITLFNVILLTISNSKLFISSFLLRIFITSTIVFFIGLTFLFVLWSSLLSVINFDLILLF